MKACLQHNESGIIAKVYEMEREMINVHKFSTPNRVTSVTKVYTPMTDNEPITAK